MNTPPEIAVAWHGLPYYAAGSIAAGLERLGRPAPVIATRPAVPFEGIETRLGQAVHWIADEDPVSWQSLGLKRPDLFFQTGWSTPAFNRLGAEVRAGGGRVVAFIDNNWKNSPRQWAGAVYYRLFLRRRFAAVWVPGRSGARLCRILGVPARAIYRGLYGADPALYRSTTRLAERPKRFIFVGQLIERKGVDVLLEAFRAFHARRPDWELLIIGNGPYADALVGPGIRREPFQQAERVAALMNESRFLVLPGREEHWGLVVHEAALCGCGLILSEAIGAAPDLAEPGNSFVVPPVRPDSLCAAFEAAAELTPEDLGGVEAVSLERAAAFGPEIWADTFLRIIEDLS